MQRIVFRGLTTDVEVTTDDERVAALLPDLLGTYGPPADTATLCYAIRAIDAGRFAIDRDGLPMRLADHLHDVLPLLELDLYPRLVQGCSRRWVLHAAALGTLQGAVLLAGASGAGKTTLSRALLERGWTYLTEEAAAVDQAGSVVGLARPITLAPEQRGGPLPPGATLRSYRIRKPGGIAEHLLLHPAPAQLCWSPIPLAAMVRLRHEPGETDRLRPLGGGAALAALWACSLHTAGDSLAVATALLGKHPAWELTTSTVAGACRLLDQVATASPPP